MSADKRIAAFLTLAAEELQAAKLLATPRPGKQPITSSRPRRRLRGRC